MDQLIDFFASLFQTGSWPPRWHCGEWTDFHGWLFIFSDIMIWVAYFVIPLILFWFTQKIPKLPFLPIFAYFALFIVSCGATHFLDAVIFWWPVYRLLALVKFITAIASMMTVFTLIKDVPKILKLNLNISTHSLEKENRRLEKELKLKEGQLDALAKEMKLLKQG